MPAEIPMQICPPMLDATGPPRIAGDCAAGDPDDV